MCSFFFFCKFLSTLWAVNKCLLVNEGINIKELIFRVQRDGSNKFIYNIHSERECFLHLKVNKTIAYVLVCNFIALGSYIAFFASCKPSKRYKWWRKKLKDWVGWQTSFLLCVEITPTSSVCHCCSGSTFNHLKFLWKALHWIHTHIFPSPLYI